jgi:hypothetical protein
MDQPNQSSPSPTPTTPDAAARIQSSEAQKHGGQVPKGSWVGRIQRTAAHNGGKGGGGKK